MATVDLGPYRAASASATGTEASYFSTATDSDGLLGKWSAPSVTGDTEVYADYVFDPVTIPTGATVDFVTIFHDTIPTGGGAAVNLECVVRDGGSELTGHLDTGTGFTLTSPTDIAAVIDGCTLRVWYSGPPGGFYAHAAGDYDTPAVMTVEVETVDATPTGIVRWPLRQRQRRK